MLVAIEHVWGLWMTCVVHSVIDFGWQWRSETEFRPGENMIAVSFLSFALQLSHFWLSDPFRTNYSCVTLCRFWNLKMLPLKSQISALWQVPPGRCAPSRLRLTTPLIANLLYINNWIKNYLWQMFIILSMSLSW